MKKEIVRDAPANLREETIRLMDRVAARGNRSRLIDSAVRHYSAVTGPRKLREQLKAGAVRRAQRDLSMAEEWFPVEEEACRMKHR